MPSNFIPNTIVALRLWALGESILALPALKALKEKYPGSRLVVVATSSVAPVFRGHVFIDQIDVVSPNPWVISHYAVTHYKQFDLAVDFEPYLQTSAVLAGVIGKFSLGFATCGRQIFYSTAVLYNDAQHVVNTNLDLLKPLRIFSIRPQLPTLQHSQKDQKNIEQRLTKFGFSPKEQIVLIAPSVGLSATYRRWPWQRFAKLADLILDLYACRIVWIGLPSDRSLIEKTSKFMNNKSVQLTNLTLGQLFVLMKKGSLLISNDSGTMHVGVAMKIPTIGIFGPNTPVRFGPWGEGHQALYHASVGVPVINVHQGEIPDGRLAVDRFAHMVAAVSVEEVWQAVQTMRVL